MADLKFAIQAHVILTPHDENVEEGLQFTYHLFQRLGHAKFFGLDNFKTSLLSCSRLRQDDTRRGSWLATKHCDLRCPTALPEGGASIVPGCSGVSACHL